MKNLTIFRSEKGWKPNFELLNNNLSVAGKLGYAWKDLRDNNPFITVGANHMITCEKQEKLLPNQVIEKELKARIEQIEKDQGYKVGKKQKRDLKEQIIEALYVKAFTVIKLVNVWINTEHDLLCIETTSTNVADDVIAHLIRDLEWRGHRLETNMSTKTFMIGILANDAFASNFGVGENCVLESITESGSRITYKNEFIEDDRVKEYINQGRRTLAMELHFLDQCRFTLKENLVISKITLQDIITEDGEHETENDRFDAEFTIRAGQCINLINELIAVLGEKGPEQS